MLGILGRNNILERKVIDVSMKVKRALSKHTFESLGEC